MMYAENVSKLSLLQSSRSWGGNGNFLLWPGILIDDRRACAASAVGNPFFRHAATMLGVHKEYF
jgi:hypothetical protein